MTDATVVSDPEPTEAPVADSSTEEQTAAAASPSSTGARTLDEKIDQRVMLHMPVDIRSASLAFLAICASIALLRWTEEFIVPVLLGVMVSYALTPLIDRMESWRIPRMLGAALVMTALIGAVAFAGYALRGQADDFLGSLPQLAAKVRDSIVGKAAGENGTFARVQKAATAIEVAAGTDSPATSANPGKGETAAGTANANAQAQTASGSAAAQEMSIRGYLITGTLGALAFFGQSLVVVFVALFLLGTGNTFRRKMIKLAGPKLSQRRITVKALDEVHLQIQRYLLVQVATSVLVAFVTAIAFFFIGLNNAIVWGIVAGFANLIPYVGSVATSGLAAIAGLVQFGHMEVSILLAVASFSIHLIVGNLVTPWLTGRTSKMSPFVVFVSVLFFGWLWGVAGLILAFPITVTVKIVCDRIENLNALGDLLGG